MIFPLRNYRLPTPIASLGGGVIRRKPVIPIDVTGPGGTDGSHILVDTGADDVVFPLDMAVRIGVDLANAPRGSARGVVGPSAGLWYAPVILLLQDHTEIRRWRAVVGFTGASMRIPLLGIAGGLEHFRTILDVEQGVVMLEVKPSLPATQDAVP